MCNLSVFDNLLVRITTIDDEFFEGECEFLSEEYVEHEYGIHEEALQIDDWLFQKSVIRRVERIFEKEHYTWYNRTEHRMRLEPESLASIESGQKTIELRLYDEKRRKIRVGDVIRFTSTVDETEILRVLVKELFVFPTFEELYQALPLTELGYTQETVLHASSVDMESYYSLERQKQYGVVGIRMELL